MAFNSTRQKIRVSWLRTIVEVAANKGMNQRSRMKIKPSRYRTHVNPQRRFRQHLQQGKTKSSVLLRSGLQVDLRKLPQVSYGAGLHHITRSKAHNIAVRKLGQQKGLKINEYVVYKSKQRIAG